MNSNQEFYTQLNKQQESKIKALSFFDIQDLNKFMFHTPFSRKLLEDMLH